MAAAVDGGVRSAKETGRYCTGNSPRCCRKKKVYLSSGENAVHYLRMRVHETLMEGRKGKSKIGMKEVRFGNMTG